MREMQELGAAMSWGLLLRSPLVVILLLLSIAALIKYLFFR